MRILHVIRTLNPAWGGPVEGLRNLAAQAGKRGHEVEVACGDHPQSSWLAQWDLKVHAPGRVTSGRYGLSARLDAWLADNLCRGSTRSWSMASGCISAMRFGRRPAESQSPYFLFIHGALDPWFKRTYPLKHIKKTIYWKLVEHRVLRDAERVLFTTEEEMVLAERAFLPWACRPVGNRLWHRTARVAEPL